MTEKPSEIVVRVWARLMMAQQLALAAIEQDLKAAGLPPLVWYDVLLEVERAGGEGLRPFALEAPRERRGVEVKAMIEHAHRITQYS